MHETGLYELQPEVVGTSDPAVAPPLRAVTWYRVDGSPVSLKEWGGFGWMPLLTYVVCKVFRSRAPVAFGLPAVDSTESFQVTSERMPADVMELMSGRIAELSTLGFGSPTYSIIEDPFNRSCNYYTTMRHPSRPVLASVVTMLHTAGKGTVRVSAGFVSASTQGEFLTTLSGKSALRPPPGCHIVFDSTASLASLLEKHVAEVSRLMPGRVQPLTSDEQVDDLGRRQHGKYRDEFLRRGIFRPRSIEDERRAAAITAAARSGSPNAPILTEIARLQNKSSSWVGSLIMLAVSAAVFVWVGLANVKFGVLLATLVPILFFHELGHFVTMRIVGYRNLKMFFIPGFGAAVTGSHYNVPGWKKVLVALMGPAPGIVLGLIVGLAGALLKVEWASQLGYFLLALNGFNLLPILPLDGGQIAHAVLFCRHPILDVLFRVLACVALFALALLLKVQLLMYVAIPVILGIPLAYRTATIVRDLRKAGVAAASPDDQTIPFCVADRIIEELKSRAKKPQLNIVLARQTLTVYEALNSRPPRWLASTGLLTLHAGFLAVALLGIGVLVLAKRGDLNRNQGYLPSNRIVASVPIASPPGSGETLTILATWPNPSGASAAAAELSGSLEQGESLAVVGDTVILSNPTGNEALLTRRLDRFRALAAEVATQSKLTDARFSFAMVAPTADAAEALSTELSEYFGLPITHGLIAPWSSMEQPTPAQMRARRTYKSLLHFHAYDDARIQPIIESIDRARELGLESRVKELQAQQEVVLAEVRRAHAEGLIARQQSEVDVTLVRAYIEVLSMSSPSTLHEAAALKLAPMLGKAVADPAGPDWDGSWATQGWVHTQDRVVRISGVVFAHPARGLTSFLAWLNARGYAYVRYEIHNDYYDDE